MTGLLVGIGGDNYWGVGHGFWFTPPTGEGKLVAILVIGVIFVGACDIVALCVVFAGAVQMVLRVRGHI
jgi:hypothetical protein